MTYDIICAMGIRRVRLGRRIETKGEELTRGAVRKAEGASYEKEGRGWE